MPASTPLRVSHTGIFWGAMAGGVIGTGISLSIGLFYTAQTSMIAAVVFASAVMGGIFGYVVSHLLNEETSLVERLSESSHHRILGNFRGINLEDHRLLRGDTRIRKLPPLEAVDSTKPVRTG